MDSYILTSLLVFENTINEELIRSLHVYRLKDGKEKRVEREFIFSVDGAHMEMAAKPMLRLRRLRLPELSQGPIFGFWRCILAFGANHSPYLTLVPSLLSLSRNPKLKSIPTLANDLQLVMKLSSIPDHEDASQHSSKKVCNGDRNDHPSKRSVLVLDQALNFLPYSVPTSQESNKQQIGQRRPVVVAKKKKRAATKDIARIALEDLVKYISVPIVEASRNLNVGLTVLTRNCREFGIPRWPHRRIKSLDCLICNLQEEAEAQNQGNKDAAIAVAKRRRMLEWERENIETKPFMETQSETKRFRQDVFKRRHRARSLGSQDL